jgi:hypothetical protein
MSSLSLSLLLLPSRLDSHTHVHRLLLQEPRTHTTETWDQTRLSLSRQFVSPTTNKCKQHEQHELDVRYYSPEA